jgi:hypothetical protein
LLAHVATWMKADRGPASRWLAQAALVFAACLNTACVAWNPPGLSGLPQRGQAAGLPQQVQLRDTPFVDQAAAHCGPASLAMVLAQAGRPVPVDTLVPQVFVPGRNGALQAEMLGTARRHGLMATAIAPSLDGLMAELAAGRPVLVLQNLGLALAPLWHYAVVIGYDLAAGEVVVHSGHRAQARESLRTFGHTWSRSGHWGFVVHEPGQWPATANEARALESALGFERVAEPERAARAYAGAVERWPQTLAFVAGLGNARHAQGRLDEAARWYRQAAEQHGSAAAWLNLALTLQALGRGPEAIDAARSAWALQAGVHSQQAEALLATLLAR